MSLIHFVTNNCNARCDHCFIDFNDKSSQREHLNLEEIIKITKTCGEQLMNVNLTGGEPFLRRDLYEIAQAYLENAKVNSVFITTHGGFTDRVVSFAERFKLEYPKNILVFSFSIDDFEEEHNAIRKVKNLYKHTLESYRKVKKISPNILANIAITVSEFNYKRVKEFYLHLREIEGVDAVTITLARDEGVYKTPPEVKNEIYKAYVDLTSMLKGEISEGKLGYSNENYLGRMINFKNQLMYDSVAQTYIKNEYLLPCQAASVLGVIHTDGSVYPCEVLGKSMGKLKDFDYDLLKLWKSNSSRELRGFIKETKCRCTYECAWSYNILLEKKYYPDFFKALINL